MTDRRASNSGIGYQPGTSPRNNVISFLDDHARTSPDRPALLWAFAPPPAPPSKMTFRELATQVESAAAGFARLGLRAGDRVFLFVPMSPALYIAMFGVQRIGAIAVFLDSWARRSELGSSAAQAAPRAFIGPEMAFGLTRDDPAFSSVRIKVVVGPHQASYTASLEELAGAGESIPATAVEQEHTALITFTTGSSGTPKGADRTHRFLAAQHYALDRCLPYLPTDIDLPTFPVFSLNNLAGGVTTLLPAINLARQAPTDGAVLLEQIRSTGATSATLSPSLLLAVSRAAQEQNLTLPGLRRCATGGAPVSSANVTEFKKAAPNAEVHILYGSTEVEPIAHIVDREMIPEGGGDGVCVGALADGLDHRLIRLSRDSIELDSAGWPGIEVPGGAPGELVVTGEHVCRDYYRNPEAFRRAKIRDREGRVWHRTGDVCRRDEEGRFWIVGRVHNAIPRGGEILFPVKPELVMKRLPFVKSAAYLGLPDPALKERACAAFSLLDNAREADPEAAVRRALVAEGIPVDDVRRVAEIPLDPRHHSKVEYNVLRERLSGKDPS